MYSTILLFFQLLVSLLQYTRYAYPSTIPSTPPLPAGRNIGKATSKNRKRSGEEILSEGSTASDWRDPSIPKAEIERYRMAFYRGRYWPIHALRVLVCCGLTMWWDPYWTARVLSELNTELGDLDWYETMETFKEVRAADSIGYHNLLQALSAEALSNESNYIDEILAPMRDSPYPHERESVTRYLNWAVYDPNGRDQEGRPTT